MLWVVARVGPGTWQLAVRAPRRTRTVETWGIQTKPKTCESNQTQPTPTVKTWNRVQPELNRPIPKPNKNVPPQFRRDSLEALSLSDPNSRPTWSPGCFGWWTGGGKGFAITDGAKARHACAEGFLWRQGDQMEVSCARGRPLGGAFW